MKKYNFLIYIIIAIIVVILIIFFVNKNNNPNNENSTSNTQSNITAERTSTNVNQEMAENRIANIIENKNEILDNATNNEPNSNNIKNDNPISSYSTQIKDKSEGRLTNIGITCSVLSGTIVHPGEIFSFNKVVGQPTSERGYQEASVIINHKTEKGIGGGNCQVSSTLYNAVLEAGNLAVIERNEHGKDVTYVPEGRDAAVSYGSLDFKFRNDLNYDIRIEAATDNNTLTISLYKN